ncbi:MAG: 2-C-methyl-D-erythritol 4-phosphate cytidylyltransferase [Tissierellia bacterium]|nr:2-C-methyl-D-erythritol 4-phosphate cytidylyltransferase [Tissierellia bacterium]
MDDHNTALIPVAGSSRRMKTNTPKQFLTIGDEMVIEKTLNVFDGIKEIQDIILVIREEDEGIYQKLLKKYKKEITLIHGGDSREESTYNGIKALKKECNYVICHDGARPFVKEEIIKKTLMAAKINGAAICGVPVKDTIKYADKNKFVEYTPERSRLYQIQTPQVFQKDLLLKAYEQVFNEEIHVTDDSSLLEIIGVKVKIIMGDYSNIKITTKEDLLFGEIIMGGKNADRNWY